MNHYEKTHLSLEPIKKYLLDHSQSHTLATEMGFVWTQGDALLTFASSEAFLRDAVSRSNVASVLVDSTVSVPSDLDATHTEIISVRDARLNFVRLHNSLRNHLVFAESSISSSARVHPSAVIDSVGVIVGARTVIEPHVVVQRGTTIGEDCVIRAGSQLGSDALDIKEDEDGNPYMTDHLGGVVIGDFVEIGHNSVVDRSIFRQTATTIASHTKIGCLSNISHGVRLGRRNKIAAGVKICGSTVVGDDNWIGPGAIVSNLLSVGSRNYIALGAHVLSDLEDDWKVVGIRVFKERKLF